MEQSEEDIEALPEYSDLMKFIVEGIMIATCCGLGMLANVICMFVMSRPALKKGRCASVNTLLMSMAGVDIIVLVTSLIMCGFPAIAEHLLTIDPIEGQAGRWILEKMEMIFLYTLPYIYPVGLSAQTASIYLTLVVTIERFIVVCKPLEARSICTIKRTRLVIMFICLFGLTFNLTRFLELKHVWYEVPIEEDDAANSESQPSCMSNICYPQNASIQYSKVLVDDDNLLRDDNFSSKQGNLTDTSLQNYFVNNSTFHPISQSPNSVTSSENFTQRISRLAGRIDSHPIEDIGETIQDVENNKSVTATQTRMRLEYTSLRLDPLYIKVACWTYLTIMYVIPFLALLLFNLRIGRDIRQARKRRKYMLKANTSQYTIRNISRNDLSDTHVIEMNIVEDLIPCTTRQEELLETVQAILNSSPDKILFDRKEGSPQDIATQEDISTENEALTKIRKRSMVLYRNNTIKRQQIEEREQHGLAIMQMVVVLVFMICNFLAMLCNIFELFDVSAVNVTFVSNFLVTLNHSINLFIYCAFGERFRKELKRVARNTARKFGKYCCMKSENKSDGIPLESQYSTSRVRKSISLPENIGNRLFQKNFKEKFRAIF